MIVQELVPHGALSEYLVDNREKINPNLELRIWASQIACGKCSYISPFAIDNNLRLNFP